MNINTVNFQILDQDHKAKMESYANSFLEAINERFEMEILNLIVESHDQQYYTAWHFTLRDIPIQIESDAQGQNRPGSNYAILQDVITDFLQDEDNSTYSIKVIYIDYDEDDYEAQHIHISLYIQF